jgi:exosortase/archaeosortase family protein
VAATWNISIFAQNQRKIKEETMKRPSIGRPSLPKATFSYIFIILAFVLMLMPFVTTFNDILTRIVMSLDAYRYIQDYVVPWEVRLVGVILYPFGFAPQVMGDYLAIGTGEKFLIEIAWNCIGWQSLLFFIMTAFVGLQGDKYTFGSKLKALAIGFLGTFLINLLRITFVVLLSYYFGQNVAIIFHDYGSTLAVIGWLLFFWWFSYNFVLEEKNFSI